MQDADKAKSDLQSVGKSADTVQQGFGAMLKQGLANAAGFAIFNLGAKAIGFVKDQMVDSIQVAMKHQDIMAQTAQAIKSTGDASGMSAQQISNLALSLSKTTDFSDDTIQSGENLLLTFTHIGKNVFPQTTQAMLDMSQAMHMGPEQAALQLGKALDDPKTGLTALQREGVKFSAAEKEQIAVMLAHNNVAGAQKIMLKELQTEFGGSAEAAGKTFAGQLAILKNKLTDVKQEIGGALLPILSNMVSDITGKVLPAIGNIGHYFSLFDLSSISYQWKQLGNAFHELLMPLNSNSDAMGKLSPILITLRNDFSKLLDAGIRDIAAIIGGIAGAVKGFAENINVENITAFSNGFKQAMGPLQNIANLLKGELGKEFKDLGQDAQQVGTWFMSSVVPALKQAAPGFESLGRTILTTVIPAAIQIRGVFADVIQNALQKFGPIIGQIVPPLIVLAGIIAKNVSEALQFLIPYIVQASKAIGDFANDIMDRVAPIITNVINGITPILQNLFKYWSSVWPGMSEILRGVFQVIVGIIQVAWSIITGIFNIALDVISGNWRQAWTDLGTMLSGIWNGIKTMFRGALTELGGILDTVLSSIIGDATNAGSNIVKGIADGITNALHFVTDAITNVTSWISAHLPHSPAKVGPLRDLLLQGSLITEQLSQGMIASMPKLNTALGQLVKPISMTLSPTGALPAGTTGIPASVSSSTAGSGGSGGSGQPLVINVNLAGQNVAQVLLPEITNAIRYSIGGLGF